MSFFEELKRRNVFRVGIAYVVGAWLLLQLTDVLSELLGLPSQVGPVVVAVVVVGFPVVLFAAWAYELTPQGIKRESEVRGENSITRSTGRKLNALISVLMAVAIAYLLYDKFVLREPGAPTEPATAAVEAEARADGDAASQRGADAGIPGEGSIVPRQSIAVLPFTNRSPVAEDEFFIDGIHDDLLTNLARVSALKVISRTSVARFRETELPIPEIARELGVATVMEGAVQRAGDMVRINVQLIDAQTDEHLWAEIYDRPLTTDNLFAIQSEIAEAIAAALETKLTPDEERRLQARPTENLAAYSAYLRGMRAFERREVQSMEQALADFQRAVELDPEFALGWAGIAQVAEVLPSWGTMRREEGQAISAPAARRAMELAPDSGEANLALALVLEGEEAQAQFERTLELLPNHAMAHQWYANTLQGAPGPDWLRALALLRKAVDLDPISPNFRSQLARQLLFMNRPGEAREQLRVVIESDPDYAAAYGFMAQAEQALGNLDTAVTWAKRYRGLDSNTPLPLFSQTAIYADLKDRERLREMQESLSTFNESADFSFFPASMIAVLEHRYDAMGEILTSIPPAFVDGEQRARVLAEAATLARNYPAALRAWQEGMPGLFQPDDRETAIRRFDDRVCVVADVARRVGEIELAETLVRETFDWATQELPKYQEHAAHEANLAYCHMVLGDPDAALDQLETNLRHRHFKDWWNPEHLELFEPLWSEPRYRQIMSAFEDEMARQRANLDDAGAG